MHISCILSVCLHWTPKTDILIRYYFTQKHTGVPVLEVLKPWLTLYRITCVAVSRGYDTCFRKGLVMGHAAHAKPESASPPPKTGTSLFGLRYQLLRWDSFHKGWVCWPLLTNHNALTSTTPPGLRVFVSDYAIRFASLCELLSVVGHTSFYAKMVLAKGCGSLSIYNCPWPNPIQPLIWVYLSM